MEFGWYCVDAPGSFVPLVSAAEVVACNDALSGEWASYQNSDAGFVPLAGMPPLIGATTVLAQEPTFQACPSRRIGLTLVPGDDIPSVGQVVCTQQKHTEPRLNPLLRP